MSLSFQQSLQIGKTAETRIARWLRSRGWHILPVYDLECKSKSGVGPRFFTATNILDKTHELIAPDMLIFKTCIRWIEAKHKSRFSWWGIGKTWETGIDRKCWDDYQKIAELSGHSVWLMFLHCQSDSWIDDIQKRQAPATCPTGLYAGSIGDLIGKISHMDDRYGTSGMVYWRESSLRKLADIENIPA